MSEISPMTKEEFKEASRRVVFYGNLIMGLTAVGVVTLFGLVAQLAGPTPDHLDRWMKTQFENEMAVYVMLLLFILSLLFIPLGCALWFDRKFGLRCTGCGRSVTIRCHAAVVLKTGKCCLCGRKLFDPL